MPSKELSKVRFIKVLLIVSFLFVIRVEGSERAVSRALKQSANDNTLAAVRRSDASIRDAQGQISKLSQTEHMRRAAVYMSNRAFPEARSHWQALINYYPEDPRVAEAMFGIGRSYFLGKEYEKGYRSSIRSWNVFRARRKVARH